MGVSTNAILFYGYCWDKEIELFPCDPDGDFPEWDRIILRKRNVPDPWEAFPSEEFRTLDWRERRQKGDAWMKEHEVELNAWTEAKKFVREEFGCEIGSHCSGGCSMPYVFVSEVVARRGYPLSVTPATLAIDPVWHSLLDRFLAELGIDRPQEKPGWWLASYWSE